MVEAIPKRTSSAIHPEALRVDTAAAGPSDMCADYRGGRPGVDKRRLPLVQRPSTARASPGRPNAEGCRDVCRVPDRRVWFDASARRDTANARTRSTRPAAFGGAEGCRFPDLRNAGDDWWLRVRRRRQI